MLDQCLERYYGAWCEETEDASLLAALSLAQGGKLMQAAAVFHQAMAKEAESLDILYNYGKVCYAIYSDKSQEQELKRDFKEVSRRLFEACIDRHPDFAGAYYYLGFFYLNGGLYEKASLIWKAFLARCAPSQEQEAQEVRERLAQLADLISYERGYLAVLAGKTDEGLALLAPLMEKDPQSWNITFFVALAYRKKGEYQKAAALFHRVLAQSPSRPEAMNELGLCYAHLEDFEKAEKYFKKALLVQVDHYEILGNLAGLYIQAGRPKEAQACLDRALRMAPEDPIIKSWQARLPRQADKA